MSAIHKKGLKGISETEKVGDNNHRRGNTYDIGLDIVCSASFPLDKQPVHRLRTVLLVCSNREGRNCTREPQRELPRKQWLLYVRLTTSPCFWLWISIAVCKLHDRNRFGWLSTTRMECKASYFLRLNSPIWNG